MARRSGVWFRKQTKSYYTNFQGRQLNLGRDKAEAEKKFHLLMAEQALPSVTESSVAEILDKYLAWCQTNRADRTFDWYAMMLQSFLDSLSNQSMSVSQLKPFHVTEWAEKKASRSTVRGAMVAVQRAFNWAIQQGYIERSPIANLRKPSATRRDNCPTQEEYEELLSHATEPFRSLLEFVYETGCRPQEVVSIEAEYIKGDRVVFPIEKSKGKKQARVIYLTPKARDLLGTGFRNAKGRKWTCSALDCRMKKIAKKTGKKFRVYDIRHLFATRMLEAGLDHMTVAKLMGHKDASMLAKHYSHIGERSDYLLEQLNKVG